MVDPGDDSTAIKAVIDEYYACFNERRFVEAAALFADDAVLEQLPLLRQERGAIGYLQFVSAWLRAFPDAALIVRGMTAHENSTYDVSVEATGTHRGALDLAGWMFRPTGVRVTFGLRELLQVREGRIAFSTITVNLHEMVDKLAQVDAGRLLDHIDRLRRLAEALRSVQADAARAREITEDIGRELDAARHVVRPYYKRVR